MLPEGRWAHVRAIRQIVPVQRLYEVLLEPGDGVRNLAAWGPGDDQVPQVRAMRTGQQADGDFLLDQRGESRNQDRLGEEIDEPDERIEQGAVQYFERDRSVGTLSPGPRRLHLGSHLQDGADIQRHHQAKKRFSSSGARDMRDDREIDRRQHGLPRAIPGRLAPEQHLLVALRDDAESEVVDAMQRLGWCLTTMERERRNGGGVIAVGLGKATDRVSQGGRRRGIRST